MNVKRTKLCLCRSLLLMAGLLFAVASFAQDLTVKGKVTDTTGETVIGANVTVVQLMVSLPILTVTILCRA